MKNPQLKKAYAEEEYTPERIMELARCKRDPIYFMKKYIKIQHPKRGTIRFNMYEYQERFVRCMHENRYVLTLQPRQMGKTLTAAMYLLWFAMFHEPVKETRDIDEENPNAESDATILIASKNQGHALEIAERVRFAYEELPNWIKPGLKYWNRHSIWFDNGSRIISEATTEKTGRGLSITKMYLDELAFINLRIQEAMWASLAPTLSTGGSAIISSTPNGDTELFAQLWRRAMAAAANADSAETKDDGEAPAIGFVPFQVHWREHPERDDRYYQEMLSMLGELKVRQEIDCEFVSSDAMLISSMKLQQLTTKTVHHDDMGFKFWVPEEELGGVGKTYLISLDPATGGGKDFSVIEVFDFPSLNQVAEYRTNNVNIPLLYAKLKWVILKLSEPIGRGRSEVLWTFERNGIGEAIGALYASDEKQPEHAELYSDVPGKLGVFTSGKTKILSCLQLKQLVEKTTNGLKINSEHLLFELKNFIAKGGSYEAKKGATDDAVMATVGIMRLIKRLSEWNDDAFKQVNEYASPMDPDDAFGDEPVPFVM
jgi:Terminase large subunit, T4likevirus-type, N-terminal